MIDISQDQLQTIKAILKRHVPDYEVRAFGSRFTWTAKDYSDLDLAIVGPEKLPFKELSALKTAFEESDLSFRVDVLDWRAISPEFQKVIEQGYEVIQKPELGRRSKEWGKYSLQSLCSYIADGKHGDCRNQDNSGFYFLSAKDVSEGRLFYEKARQITKEDFKDTHKRTRLEAFDILLTNSGTIGRMAVAEDNELTSRTTFQKSVAILKPIKQKVFPRFLYYCLVDRKSDIVNAASGTTQQNLLLGDLRSFEVEIPEDIETQRCIADILSALDDKIELNRQTNATLEAITQAIFKEWFVKFRFPGYEKAEFVDSDLGKIPKGWEIKNLFETLSVTYGYPFRSELFNELGQGVPVIRIRNILAGSTSTSTLEQVDEMYSVKDGDILVGMDGNFHLRMWSSGMAWLNQRVVRFRPKDYRGWFFAYISLRAPVKQKELSAVGTTVGHLSDKDLKSISFVVPNDMVAEKFSDITDPYYWQVVNLLIENQKLVATRDLLLPRLMSGEIQVNLN